MALQKNSAAPPSGSVAQDLLQSFVRRIEALEDEIGALNGDKSEVYKEAKGNGFDVKVLRKVIADRRKDASERNEFDEVYQLYWDAIHGVVRAHVENIEQITADALGITEVLRYGVNGREPEHDADGVIIEPQPEPSEALRQIEAGPVAKAGDPSEAAMLPQTGQLITASVSAAGRGSVESPATISDRTKPNPWCLDPEECGLSSWDHFCLRCQRVKAERLSERIAVHSARAA